MRCTVVAHLTLAFCLAHLLSRLRGSELLPLASLIVGVAGETRRRQPSSWTAGQSWAQTPSQLPDDQAPFYVLRRCQPVRDLLSFFSTTSHSSVPIVSDDSIDRIVGLLSRRDLLRYLDLSLQSVRLSSTDAPRQEPIQLDLEAPVGAMLDVLKKSCLPTDPDSDAFRFYGATVTSDPQVPMKSFLVRLLTAENRKVFFVDSAEQDRPPQLLKMVSLSDAWRWLLGDEATQMTSVADHTTLSSAAADAGDVVVTDA
jgi:CBS domain-containing protein